MNKASHHRKTLAQEKRSSGVLGLNKDHNMQAEQHKLSIMSPDYNADTSSIPAVCAMNSPIKAVRGHGKLSKEH